MELMIVILVVLAVPVIILSITKLNRKSRLELLLLKNDQFNPWKYFISNNEDIAISINESVDQICISEIIDDTLQNSIYSCSKLISIEKVETLDNQNDLTKLDLKLTLKDTCEVVYMINFFDRTTGTKGRQNNSLLAYADLDKWCLFLQVVDTNNS